MNVWQGQNTPMIKIEKKTRVLLNRNAKKNERVLLSKNTYEDKAVFRTLLNIYDGAFLRKYLMTFSL